MADPATPTSPPASLQVTNAMVEQALKVGRLVKIHKEDLTPEAQLRYRELTKDVAWFEKNPEIILVPGVSMVGRLEEAKTTEGMRFIVADEGSHHWTPEYVKKNEMKSQKELDDFVKQGILKDARSDGLPEETYKRFVAVSKKAGIDPPPAIYVLHDTSPVGIDPAPLAYARQTQEGKPYIVINEGTLKLTPDQFVAYVGGHENDHIRRGDVTPEGNAAMLNNPALQHAVERRADIEGALAACDPKSLKEALAISRRLDRDLYMMDHPGGTEQQYTDFMNRNDIHHPSLEDRLARLITVERHMIKDASGVCSVDDYNNLVAPYVKNAVTPGDPAKGR